MKKTLNKYLVAKTKQYLVMTSSGDNEIWNGTSVESVIKGYIKHNELAKCTEGQYNITVYEIKKSTPIRIDVSHKPNVTFKEVVAKGK